MGWHLYPIPLFCFCVGGELSEMATGSLTNSLKGIPSNDLLPGISDNNIHILSTGSNVSFSDQNINAEEEMDTGGKLRSN